MPPFLQTNNHEVDINTGFKIQNYRPKQVSQLLGVSIGTFWNYVKQGKLATKRLSKGVTIVEASEIERFMQGVA